MIEELARIAQEREGIGEMRQLIMGAFSAGSDWSYAPFERQDWVHVLSVEKP
jgi:hypothetical protein